MIHLDRDAEVSLIDQIVSQIAGLIHDGQLPPGTRLPSIRKLAAAQGISAATVVGAFDRLAARGLIEARAASGYFVSARRQPAPRPRASLPPRSEVDALWMMEKLLQRQENLRHVGSGFLPESWLEDMLSSKLLAQIARKGKRFYAQPGSPQGYPPLRQQLALKLNLAGIPADADTQVMTTFGATQGIDLIIRSLLSPGDTVAVEEPAYFAMYAQFRAYGVKLVGVPRLPTGPDVAVLEEVASTYRPRLFFTQTLLHNPTGGNSDPATLFRLLELAQRHDFLIVEDDVFGDFHPQPQALRLAQIDRLERVIHIGSFAKTLSPSIRIGYLAAAPQLLRLFLENKMLAVLTGSELDERLVHELLASGLYRKHLERVRGKLSQYRAQALLGLRAAGLGISDEGDSGLFLWAALPEGIDAQTLLEDAAANGYLLTPGDLFFLRQSPAAYLRFNAAGANHQPLFDYLRQRLAALQTAQATARAPAAPTTR